MVLQPAHVYERRATAPPVVMPRFDLHRSVLVALVATLTVSYGACCVRQPSTNWCFVPGVNVAKSTANIAIIVRGSHANVWEREGSHLRISYDSNRLVVGFASAFGVRCLERCKQAECRAVSEEHAYCATRHSTGCSSCSAKHLTFTNSSLISRRMQPATFLTYQLDK